MLFRSGRIIRGELEEDNWWKYFMPQDSTFGPGEEVYNLSDEKYTRNLFSFQIDMFIEGYGYSFRKISGTGVFIIILLIQLTIAIAFIFYSIATNSSSSSWDSPAELIALAMASEFPHDRKRLSTGEASIKSLKKLYCAEAGGNTL